MLYPRFILTSAGSERDSLSPTKDIFRREMLHQAGGFLCSFANELETLKTSQSSPIKVDTHEKS